VDVHLDDDTSLAIRLLALRLGMSAESVARFALTDFLRRHAGA